jgi:drug/metabolite transporter (DMT)-like permease
MIASCKPPACRRPEFINHGPRAAAFCGRRELYILERQTVIGVLAAIVVVLSWSGWMVISRLGATSTMSTFDMAGIRFVVGSLASLPLMIKHRPWQGLSLKKVLVLNLAGMPYTLICFQAFSLAPAAHGGVFLNGCLPIFTALIGWLWIRQSQRPTQLMGLAVILIGVFCVSYEGFGSVQGPRVMLGDLLFLAGITLYATYMVAARVWRTNATQTLFCVTFFSGLVYTPIWLLGIGHNLGAVPWEEILLQAVYQGVVAGVLGMGCMGLAIKNLGADATSAYSSLVPGGAALLAIPILGEMPGPIAWAGMILVTGGILLALGIVGKRRRAKAT